MTPITVKELANVLNNLSKSYGDYIVQVSDDDEMNGTHCLWGFKPMLGDPVEYLDDKTNKIKETDSIILS